MLKLFIKNSSWRSSANWSGKIWETWSDKLEMNNRGENWQKSYFKKRKINSGMWNQQIGRCCHLKSQKRLNLVHCFSITMVNHLIRMMMTSFQYSCLQLTYTIPQLMCLIQSTWPQTSKILNKRIKKLTKKLILIV